MNREVILLNNDSVIYLQMGNPSEAFKLLTEASNIVTKLFQRQCTSTNFAHRPYRYTWVNFSDSMSGCFRDLNRRDENGSLPFLYLSALKIATSCTHEDFDDFDDDDTEDSLCACYDSDDYCPCGIAWVVWYNLAIACSILGLGRGENGHQYLEKAYRLYEVVRGRISEQSPSIDWSTLLMAVFNNQSCIYYEYAMYDESIECLDKVKDVLRKMPRDGANADWQVFSLNLMLLRKPKLAAAA